MATSFRVLHLADLHLSQAEDQQEYGFSVLREVLGLARSEEVDLVLAVGDLFDSRRDFEALLPKVDALLSEELPNCRMLLVPGNHEELVRGSDPLRALPATQKVEVLRDLPFGYTDFEAFDLVSVPFQSSYAGFEEWLVPPKGQKPRLLAIHASVYGAAIPEGLVEERDSVVDGELFARIGADYVAMGHIHQGRELPGGNATVVYPGSARVWRQGETGARRVYLLDIGDTVSFSSRQLHSAGEYREIRVAAQERSIEEVEASSAAWGERDWIHLALFGLAASGENVSRLAAALRKSLEGRVRRVTIDHSEVLVVPAAEDSALVRRFLDEWQSRESRYLGTEKEGAWREARLLGLEKIARALR